MRTIALESRSFVLSACQYLEAKDTPDALLSMRIDAAPEVLIGGGSVIVSPLAEVLAGPTRGGEAILTAELDLDELLRARMDFDVAGHYARSDVFTLDVNDSRMAAIKRKAER